MSGGVGRQLGLLGGVGAPAGEEGDGRSREDREEGGGSYQQIRGVAPCGVRWYDGEE